MPGAGLLKESPSAMKVLITGAGGQLGTDLAAECQRRGDEVVALTSTELDITSPDAVDAAIAEARPEVIVNTAAWTAVDDCESDPERALNVNGRAVENLRAAADGVGAHLVQLSTDYVFDGTLDRPYRPDDAPNPLSVYGSSKLAGEQAAGDAATIVRTSWVCGLAGNNMVKTVLRLVTSHTTLSFVDDQLGNPTFTPDLAVRVRDLARRRPGGIHHVTNSTPDDAGVSWYGFVREIVTQIGRDPEMVQPIGTADLDPPRPAPRPANSVLENTTTEPLRDYREALADMIAALINP